MDRPIRVRFAPSPTGPLHIGGVRTALFNYLFARRGGGKMILRIEDTDSTRFVPGAEDYINESLRWLGIGIDEGVREGGPHGPYRQSERRDIYKKYVKQLLDAGRAYIAFDTPQELAEAREKTPNFQYDAHSRGGMRNSLTLPAGEVQRLIDGGTQYVVRFLVEPGRDVVVNDRIRGRVVINSDIIDDKVLYKSADELPTYHLANIVDDHLMEVTHVIRGEEWLPSAPLHVLLYEAFGWTDTMPEFVHLPLLLKPVGNGKLSKRDGDKLGFPVFPLEWRDPKTGAVSAGYRENGYLPEAVVNFLALLGWNPGDDTELMDMDTLISKFSFEHCSKAGAKFDYKKGAWFNHEYIMRMADDELAALFGARGQGHNRFFAGIRGMRRRHGERSRQLRGRTLGPGGLLLPRPDGIRRKGCAQTLERGNAAHHGGTDRRARRHRRYDVGQRRKDSAGLDRAERLPFGQRHECLPSGRGGCLPRAAHVRHHGTNAAQRGHGPHTPRH